MSDRVQTRIPFLATITLVAASCATPGGPAIGEIAAEINQTRSDRVPIAVGDTIEVRFAYHEDWNQIIVVQPNGTASFKAIPADVPVAGLTPEQLDESLEESYANILDSTDLLVRVQLRAASSVTVMGQVGSPGVVEMGADGHLTLVQAIGAAGTHDITSAYLADTLLIRWDSTAQKQIYWRVDARPRHWDAEIPILLQPYDTIFIPHTPVYGVGIWIDNWIRRMIPLPFFQSL